MLLGVKSGHFESTTLRTAASSMACAAPWARWGSVGWQASPTSATLPFTQVGRGLWTRSFYSQTLPLGTRLSILWTMGQKSPKVSSMTDLSPFVVYVAEGAAAKFLSGWVVERLYICLLEMGLR